MFDSMIEVKERRNAKESRNVKRCDPVKRLKAAFKTRKQHTKAFDDYFIPNCVERRKRQKWSDPAVREAVADVATTLRKTDRYTAELHEAFKDAGLNPANPYDWRTLLEFFVLAHYEKPAKRGRKNKRDTLALCQLLIDYGKAVCANPGKNDTWICDHLVRHHDSYKKYARRGRKQPGFGTSIRRMLSTALNPKMNPIFGQYFEAHLAKSRESCASEPSNELRKNARKMAIRDIARAMNSGRGALAQVFDDDVFLR